MSLYAHAPRADYADEPTIVELDVTRRRCTHLEALATIGALEAVLPRDRVRPRSCLWGASC